MENINEDINEDMNEDIQENTIENNTEVIVTTEELPKKKLSKKSKQGIIAFCVILGLVVILSFTVLLSGQSTPVSSPNVTANLNFFKNTDKAVSSMYPKGNTLAVLHIEGTIAQENATYNQAWLLDTIESIQEENNYKGILLYINSPGGGVYESDEVYLALEEYKATTQNPVWAYFGPLAASGGYYIGCAADQIYANRNTLTGSIGVIFGQSFDLTELMEKYGIKMTTITAGRNKNMMNIDSPMTAEHKVIMQSIADECYDQFTSIVADSRGMDIQTIRTLADGRIYTANQAKNNGLIDEIGSLEQSIEDMKLLFDTKVKIEHLNYEHEVSFSDFMFNMFSDFQKSLRSDDTLLLETIQDKVSLPQEIKYPAYYYNH